MKLNTLLTISILSLGLAGCTSDDSDGGQDGTDGTAGGATDTGGDDLPGTDDGPTPTSITATPADSSSDDADGSSDDGSTDGGSSTGEAPGFEFSDTPPERYARVDRMGMPVINTVVITSKDDYNAANPTDDVAGTFLGEIAGNVTGLHMALDPDLEVLGLVPCEPADCLAQAGPLVVPDVIAIDPSAPAGFPNGRLPADPVVDVTLALVLLDLTVKGQDVGLFAGLPLNPPANDLPFMADFPFLAPPH